MKLQRALELCQQSLDASKSNIVKVNRFALIHVLANRVQKINEYEHRINELEVQVKRLRYEIEYECRIRPARISPIKAFCVY